MDLNLGGKYLIKVLMNGCNGKMGQTISNLIAELDYIEIVAGIDRNPDKVKNSYPVYSSFENVKERIDVTIDFSHPSALQDLLYFCINNKTALVEATTGLSPLDNEILKQTSESIPILVSANMSIGINHIMNLISETAKTLQSNFDIEIIEKHHNEKKDVPSGTALMLADEINNALNGTMNYVYDRSKQKEKRNKNDIGIHSLRGGSIPGEHSIIFAGLDEIIEIKHTALSRVIFAKGTLEAVRFIHNKEKGLFSMKDLLKEMI